MLAQIIIIFILILINGIFAMSEISVVAAKKVRLQQRAEDGDERARTALALTHDPKLDDLALLEALAGQAGLARKRLSQALAACRKHFDKEERIVFPLAERTLKGDTLQALGAAWMKRREVALK